MEWPVAGDLHRWPADVKHAEIIGNRDVGAAIDIDGRVVIAPQRIQARIGRGGKYNLPATVHECVFVLMSQK